MAEIQKISPYLWFDDRALEAAQFYCSIFQNSAITYSSPMIVEFTLSGMDFIALNGGPRFTFNESVSFLVHCRDQDEVDHFWNALTADGGAESMCGWCKDKFGLSWQIVPVRFMEMMRTGTADQRERVFEVMMSMRKMVVADFEEAFSN